MSHSSTGQWLLGLRHSSSQCSGKLFCEQSHYLPETVGSYSKNKSDLICICLYAAPGTVSYLPSLDPYSIFSVGNQASIHLNIVHLSIGCWFAQASNTTNRERAGQTLLSWYFSIRPIRSFEWSYLIPWPGPQTMFLTWISEELLTIDMQSSPERMQYKQWTSEACIRSASLVRCKIKGIDERYESDSEGQGTVKPQLEENTMLKVAFVSVNL